jgi:hypothetical protein
MTSLYKHECSESSISLSIHLHVLENIYLEVRVVEYMVECFSQNDEEDKVKLESGVDLI